VVIARIGATLALMAGSCGVFAHHSFPSFYFEEQMVRITGELVEFDYRAPHAWVKIKTRGEDGNDVIVAAEWSNPSRLARDGVTKTTLQIGDQVIVAGSPGRNPDEHRLHLKAIQRVADGWEWPQDRRRRR
jgi:hypothetical protein